MTNNLAERTVKTYVINRKNFLFIDTEKGTDASEAVMSIIETAKRNNLDVYGYLRYLLIVLPEIGTDLTDDQIKRLCRRAFHCRHTAARHIVRYGKRYTAAYSYVQFTLY